MTSSKQRANQTTCVFKIQVVRYSLPFTTRGFVCFVRNSSEENKQKGKTDATFADLNTVPSIRHNCYSLVACHFHWDIEKDRTKRKITPFQSMFSFYNVLIKCVGQNQNHVKVCQSCRCISFPFIRICSICLILIPGQPPASNPIV